MNKEDLKYRLEQKLANRLYLDWNAKTQRWDCDFSVNIEHMNLSTIPIKFGVIDGDFYCGHNRLTNLENSPTKTKSFYCTNNQLTSLEGAPIETHSFYCEHNRLENLKHAPAKTTYGFRCNHNKITSLIDLPNYNKLSYFECNNNQLKSLEGMPKEVGILWAHNNKLTNLIGFTTVLQNFRIENNPITSLEGLPDKLKKHIDFQELNLTEAVDIVVRSFDPAVGIGPNTISTLDYQPMKDIERAHIATFGEYTKKDKKIKSKLKKKKDLISDNGYKTPGRSGGVRFDVAYNNSWWI